MRCPEPCANLAVAHRWSVRLGLKSEGPQWRRLRRRARPRAEALEERALLSVASDPTAAWAASTPVDPAASMLVKFSPQTSSAQVQADLAAVGARLITAYPSGPSLISVAPWASRDAALAALRQDSGLTYAEADGIIHADTSIIPNDPKFSQQWGLSMIDAPQAWSITTGSSSTIVAILDTGIDLKNTEFAGRIWLNTAKSTARRQVWGWNFVSNSSNAQDDNGHGTHVAGILAAAGNNGVGVAGVDWGTRIMPLKILDSSGNGTTDDAVSAVYFAANNGARVINASWGGDVWTQAMSDALNYANSKGVVFVTAAGNESANNDVTTTYPASFRTANELVVAAVDSTGNLAGYSNFGATTVDLAAPGSNIVSTIPGGYAVYSGTSMATPYVAGTVALLATRYPSLSATDLVARVKATVKPMSSLQGLTITGGLVDAYYALLGSNSGATASGAPTLVPGGSSFATVERAVLTTDYLYKSLGSTPQAYVAFVFQALLGRPATTSDVNTFAPQLTNGTLTRGAFVQIIQNTSEALDTRVARWYIDDIGLPWSVLQGKSNAGVVFWATNLSQGVTEGSALTTILGSDGYYSVAGATPQSFVDTVFATLMGQTIGYGDEQYYLGQLQSGATRSSIVSELLATPLAHDVMIARLYQDELGAGGTLASLASNSIIQTLGNDLNLG